MATDEERIELEGEAPPAAGPGQRGLTPAEGIERAHVKAPTRGNRRLEALIDGINADPEVGGWWHMAQVNRSASRCRTTPGSTSRSCSTSPSACCALVKAGVEPVMVADHAMRDRDAEVVVAAGGASPRRRHVDPPRRPRGVQPVPGRAEAPELLADVYKDAERPVVIAESLHAIIGHRRRGEPYTVEAGVVRSRTPSTWRTGARACPSMPGRSGSMRSRRPRSTDRHRGRLRPRGPDRDRDEQLGRRLSGRRSARDQAARHAARRARRGDRGGRGRVREAT